MSNNLRIIQKSKNITQGTVPSANIFGGSSLYDKNGVELGTVYSRYGTDGSIKSALWVKSPVTNSTSTAEIGITYDKSGNISTHAPTPNSITDNSLKIANTSWVNSRIINFFNALYPVGSLYLGTQSVCPFQTLGIGTWTLVSQDKVLQGAGSRGTVGSTLSESLPNITGSFYALDQINRYSGAFYRGGSAVGGYGGSGVYTYMQQVMDASKVSSAYKNNAPVQPAAYLINVWQRTA